MLPGFVCRRAARRGARESLPGVIFDFAQKSEPVLELASLDGFEGLRKLFLVVGGQAKTLGVARREHGD